MFIIRLVGVRVGCWPVHFVPGGIGDSAVVGLFVIVLVGCV